MLFHQYCYAVLWNINSTSNDNYCLQFRSIINRKITNRSMFYYTPSTFWKVDFHRTKTIYFKFQTACKRTHSSVCLIIRAKLLLSKPEIKCAVRGCKQCVKFCNTVGWNELLPVAFTDQNLWPKVACSNQNCKRTRRDSSLVSKNEL